MTAPTAVRSLWSHPVVRAHLAERPATLGRSVDDALAALAALGHVRIDVEQGGRMADERAADEPAGPASVRYRVTVAAREGAGHVSADGDTLTEAALRCLLEAAIELREAAHMTAAEAQRYIAELERVDSRAGLDALERYLAEH